MKFDNLIRIDTHQPAAREETELGGECGQEKYLENLQQTT